MIFPPPHLRNWKAKSLKSEVSCERIWLQAKTAIEQAEATMDDMERQVEEIRAGLKELS